MSRSLLLLSGLALAAVAVWLVFLPPAEEGGPVMTGRDAGAVAGERPQAGALDPGRAAEAPAPAEVERSEAAPAHAAAPAATDVLPSLPDGEGIRVEVVAADDGRPLAGAEVLVVDTGRVDEMALQEAMAQDRDINKVFDRLGERYRTRADGSVVIPYVEELLAVAGHTATLFAFLVPAVPDADNRLVLELKPKRGLEARVVDADGAPVAGVRVALRADGNEDVLSATSAADGIARLDNVGLLDALMFRGETRVGLAILAAAPVEKDVDIDDPDAEPVELRMPPVGSLRVRLVDRDGQPSGAGIGVVAVPAEGPEHDFGRYYPSGGQVAQLSGEDGMVDFPHVALGMHVAVEARRLGGADLWRGVVRGPEVAGQTVELLLQPDDALPLVVVRLLDAAGEPLAGARLDAVLEQESENSSWSSSGPVRTDAEGLLRYPFDEEPMADAKRTLKLTREAADGVPKLVGHLDLSAGLGPGENDYGSLSLTAPPLLVSGTVLGPDGEPVAGADVHVQKRSYWGRPEDGNFHWEQLWRLSTRTGRDGSFSVEERVDAEELRVVAARSGMRQADAEFRAGTADLVLRLQPGARIAGRVLVDDGVPLDAIRVQLQGRDGEEEGGSWQSGLDQDGGFSWSELPGGLFDLTVQASNGGEVFHRVDGVRLRPGADNDDARVTEIDLRGRITGFRLRFVDAQGRKVEQVQVRTLGLEPVQHWYAWDGELDVVTAHAPLRLQVHAPGHRDVEVAGVDDDRDIELAAGIPVTVVLDNPAAIPAGWEVGAWLQPVTEEGDGFHSSDELVFDARGVGETMVPAAGPFQLHFHLGRKDGHSRWGFGSWQRIEVADLSGGQRFHVSCDAEALERTQRNMIENGDGR